MQSPQKERFLTLVRGAELNSHLWLVYADLLESEGEELLAHYVRDNHGLVRYEAYYGVSPTPKIACFPGINIPLFEYSYTCEVLFWSGLPISIRTYKKDDPKEGVKSLFHRYPIRWAICKDYTGDIYSFVQNGVWLS